MTESIRGQVIKALAYGRTHEKIKECMCGVTDEDINSIMIVEIEVEKAYYRKMGYLQ